MTTDPRTHIRDTILSDLAEGAQTARKWGDLKVTYRKEFPEVWDELVSGGEIYVTEFDGRVRLGARPTPTPETAKLIRDALVGVEDMTMDKLEKKVSAADFAVTMEHLVKKNVIDADFWVARLTPEWQPTPAPEVVEPVPSEPEPTNENVATTPELKPESANSKSTPPRAPAKRAVAKPLAAPTPAPTLPSVQAMLATTNTTLHQLVQVLSVGVGRGLLGGVADTADAATYEISRRALAQRIAVLLAIRGSITRAELAADCVSHGQRGVLKDALDWAVVIGAFNVTRPTRGRYSLADASLLGLTAEALQELVEIQRTKDSDRQAKRANEGIAKYRDRVLAR
ncbi:MAG: hypothetical protein KDB26_05685 [Microthrixaceae bacterium]|nr:hypothetical protein [Microthrixaceae bacterium]